jgi:hypothetical protein
MASTWLSPASSCHDRTTADTSTSGTARNRDELLTAVTAASRLSPASISRITVAGTTTSTARDSILPLADQALGVPDGGGGYAHLVGNLAGRHVHRAEYFVR